MNVVAVFGKHYYVHSFGIPLSQIKLSNFVESKLAFSTEVSVSASVFGSKVNKFHNNIITLALSLNYHQLNKQLHAEQNYNRHLNIFCILNINLDSQLLILNIFLVHGFWLVI